MNRVATAVCLVLLLALAGASAAVAESGVRAPQSVKPTHGWCPTNRTCFATVRWSTYSGERAVGRGSARECAGGGGDCRSHQSLKVTLFRARVVCGARRFTRMRLYGFVFALDQSCATYMR